MANQYTKKELISKKELEFLYLNKKMSYKEIADLKKISVKVIFCRMKEYSIKPRKQARRSPKKYYRNEYFYLLCKDHTRADERGRVLEHILIMEKHLGRFLKTFGHSHKDNEVVHHINLIKTDNRIENLKLMTHSEHLKLHWRLNKSGDFI